MPLESASVTARPAARLRLDGPSGPLDPIATSTQPGFPSSDAPGWFDRVGRPLVVVLAAVCVVLGGANLDLGPDEARLGLATREPLGPLGRVAGSWDVAVWPLPVALGRIVGWFEEAGPTQNAVRWPAALAACAVGYLLVRRARIALNGRAAVLVACAWFGSLAAMDRSAGSVDMLVGMGTVAALDGLLAGSAGWSVGLWASWAFLAGGWPPVALIGLTTVVLGRRGTWSWRSTVPVVLTVAAWSAWTLRTMPAAAWAAALGWPITQRSQWTLALGLLPLGWPWAPSAALVALRTVRGGWTTNQRSLIVGWLQVVGAAVVVGSVVPGLAAAAMVPALAGLALVAGAVWDRLVASGTSILAERGPRRGWAALVLGLSGITLLVVLAVGGPIGFAIAYYRSTVIVALALSVIGFGLALAAIHRRDTRRGLASLILVALAVKAAHWGYYVPESNYRTSAGPWGRAIGQWVPDRHPLYTVHDWPADLLFATGCPVRQLTSPRQVAFQPGKGSQFLLLSESEFEDSLAYPENWPKLIKVSEFEDEMGLRHRILARTEGAVILGHPYKKNSATE